MSIPYSLILAFAFTTVMAFHTHAQPPADSLRKMLYSSNDTTVRKPDSLKAVTITAQKPAVQIEGGKMVMHVANSALTTGASVFDLLKKMPGVSVSQDDNISLRGTEGINIMIDGKMNYLSGKQLSTFLKGLGADNISRIEVITTPTAEFDAAGNAGIINIVTRKRTGRGYAIDLRTAISRGSHWMFNENITASINTPRLNLFGAFDYNTPHRFMSSRSGNGITENGEAFQLTRANTSAYKIKFYTYRIGAEWRINNKHQVSSHYNGYFDDFTAPKFAEVFKRDVSDHLYSTIRTKNDIVEPYHYDAVNLSYTYYIDTTGKKLTTDAHYISYRNLSDGLMTSETTVGSTGNLITQHALRSHQPGYVTIRSAKTDLDLPYRAFSIKAGFKYASISNDNNYRFDSLQGGVFEEAITMSNHFKYEEKIAAVYFSLAKKFRKTNVLAGLRVEHTQAHGYTSRSAYFNQWEYTSFFPSISVDQELNHNKLNVSISRRINRPSYADLNPVRWYTDQYFYYAGNPGLQPEMAWLVSAAFTFNRNYVFTASYGFRDNYMTKRLTLDPAANAIKSQTANFSNMQRLDFLFSAPFTWGIWTLQAAANLHYTTYPISQVAGTLTASRWAGNVQVQQQVKLPAGFRAELAVFFNSRELWGIYIREPLFYADAGLKKSFFKDNISFQVSFTDFLRTYRFKGYSQSNITDYHFYDRPDAHRIGIAIRYHIGGKLINKKGNSIEEQERL